MTEKLPVYLGYQLSEAQIKYACENTTSNSEAAKWLHVAYPTWRKYASMYIDVVSGKSLFELHKINGSKKRLVLPKSRYRRKPHSYTLCQLIPLQEILDNKHPKYAASRFKERLIKEGWISERCGNCGYQERRPYDYEIPLKLHWIDGNKKNYNLSNIQLLCHNCYFMIVGNTGAPKKFHIDPMTGEPVPIRGDRKSIKEQKFSTGPFYDQRMKEIQEKKKEI